MNSYLSWRYKVLFDKIKAAVENIGQSLSNCVGFASDGASVNVGQNNMHTNSRGITELRADEMHLPLSCP